ncbi:hypothetical protein LJR016_001708 [Devosia sp. LjRoot16]|uniref:hypothetical protein n=1 Tax=Devosia sp. LjRoot16 TaxID=3342271 RepID=UPI003ECC5A14
MSYDALVWLLVGLGIGVTASLLLLIGYSTLEYGRLSRRFRRARTAAAAAAPVEKPVPVAPKMSLLARPAARTEAAAKPVAQGKAMTEVKPAADPKSVADDKPARPTLAVVPAPEAKLVAVAEPMPVTPMLEAKPVVAPSSEPVAAAPKRLQSVEAMFAEAFANDRLTISPEPDEAAGAAKPGAEKPPG